MICGLLLALFLSMAHIGLAMTVALRMMRSPIGCHDQNHPRRPTMSDYGCSGTALLIILLVFLALLLSQTGNPGGVW